MDDDVSGSEVKRLRNPESILFRSNEEELGISLRSQIGVCQLPFHYNHRVVLMAPQAELQNNELADVVGRHFDSFVLLLP